MTPGNRTFALLMLAATCRSAWSQPSAVELWGSVGIAQAAGDEGSIGTGAIYGGGITAPFTGGLAFEVDVQGMRAERFNPVSRVFVNPAIVFRWGSERVYGFAGGGAGVQVDTGEQLHFEFPPGHAEPVVTTRSFRESRLTFHGRGGLVVSPRTRLIIRAELFSIWHFVMPTAGIRFGLGYRF
jgi:hypothetical protein